MPTYEYACKACGHQFERRQSMKEDPIRDCPECGQPEASRMISHGNFILKGGGWYADLYSGPSNKKNGNGAASKADEKKTGGEAAGGSKATDGTKTEGGSSASKPSESKGSTGKGDSSAAS